MNTQLLSENWQDLLPWVSASAIILVGFAWVWWVGHSLDREKKIHCWKCHYRGHPRIIEAGDRGTLRVCADCGSESTVPVRPRSALHHAACTTEAGMAAVRSSV